MTVTDSDIQRAAALLQEGRLVAFPTETVYGLGADARNDAAVKRIYEAKGRPSNNPLIVHVHSLSQVFEYCDLSRSWNPAVVKERITKLATLWPGPLSIIVPRATNICATVAAGGDSVALRIPNHPVALRLLKAFNGPVAAPSANPSMYVSPTTAQHVRDGLGERVDCVLDGGPCAIGLESTVLSLLEETPKVLRPGAITLETLRETLGCVVEGPSQRKERSQTELLSPGLLAKHYAPMTKVMLRTAIPVGFVFPPRVGALVFSSWKPPFPTTQMAVLSASGNLEEVATQLFGALREFDAAGLDLIVVDVCEPIGLGEAIMDRLVRASHV